MEFWDTACEVADSGAGSYLQIWELEVRYSFSDIVLLIQPGKSYCRMQKGRFQPVVEHFTFPFGEGLQMDPLGHPFMGTAGGQGIVLVYFIKKCVSWQIVEYISSGFWTHRGPIKV